MPSSMMSEAIAPVNLSPVWVLALSRVCVMRTGIVVPADRVMVCTTGVGGGDGGGGGAWAAAGAGIGCGAGGGVGPFWATIGEGFWAFCPGRGFCGGATFTLGCGSTTRLSTTVLTPGTWATSPLAMVRAVSLVTLPARVTTPPATDAWIDCPARFWSDARRLCTCVFRVASSGVALLHPASTMARESKRIGERVAIL